MPAVDDLGGIKNGDAWDGANRALLYATIFALFALPRWQSMSALLLLGGYSIAIAIIAGVTVADAAEPADPTLGFVADRLADPIGYHNGSAALYLAAVWPAAYLASRREVPWPIRGGLLAAAGVLIEVAILSQSRGSLIAFPLTLLLYLALVPNRPRALLTALPIAAATALAAPALLDVYPAARDGAGVAAAMDGAADAVWISGAALLLTGGSRPWWIGASRPRSELSRRCGRASSVCRSRRRRRRSSSPWPRLATR